MKLLSSLLSLGCVSANSAALSCNDGDAVKMSVVLPKSLSPNTDLSELDDWSDDGNGNYIASWDAWEDSEITEETRQDAKGNDYQVLVLTKASDAACADATVDDVKVCTKTGHDLSFKCEYSLADQTLDQQDFTVSGSDKEATADGIGKLNYALSVDNNAEFKIGSKVTATITPATKNLVDATIKSCTVTHKGNKESVDIVKDNLNPTCELGAAIATGQGKEDLVFSWRAFKWTTSLDTNKKEIVEDQQVKCTIELAKKAAVKSGQTCKAYAKAAGELTWSDPLKQRFCVDYMHSAQVPLEQCKQMCENDDHCFSITHDDYDSYYDYCYLHDEEDCDEIAIDGELSMDLHHLE